MGMIPGLGAQLKDMEIDDEAFKPMEAMIRSMTSREREHPEIINGSRRKRIAAGSGCNVADLNGLLKEFQGMRKMMSQMMQMGGGGPMGALGGLLGGQGPQPAMARQAGALNQRTARAGDPMAQKMKPKHRRKRKTKKKRK